jgi:hypothetical protein
MRRKPTATPEFQPGPVAAEHRSGVAVAFLDHLPDDRGALDTPEDEAEIARFMHLLGGPINGTPPRAGEASMSRYRS